MRVHQRATRPILAARYARRSSNSRAATRPTSSHSRYVRKGIHSNSVPGMISVIAWGLNTVFGNMAFGNKCEREIKYYILSMSTTDLLLIYYY